MKHWRVLFYCCFTPLFLLVSISLTVIKTDSTFLFDFRVGQINLGRFGAALTSHCSVQSRSSLLLSCSISHLTSALQSSSLSFGLSKCPFQWSQSSVSEMFSGALSSSHLTRWQLIFQIGRAFNVWFHPPGRSFADKGGGNGDLSDNLKAALPSCWESDQDALTISSVSELDPTAVICMFWVRDSFWLAPRISMSCHISKESWTLAILCNVLCSAFFFFSESFSVFIVSKSGSSPAKIPWLARANSLPTTFSRRVLPVVFDYLLPITSPRREKLTSTPTPCGMIESMSCSTLERLADLECVSSCWCHLSVMSGNQNVLLLSIRSEW